MEDFRTGLSKPRDADVEVVAVTGWVGTVAICRLGNSFRQVGLVVFP